MSDAAAPDRPYRGPAGGLPRGVPFPPDRMPLVRAWTLRKRWHYLTFWSPELILCAADVRVGPLPQEYWGVWDRRGRRLLQRSHYLRRRVRLDPNRLTIRDGDVSVDLPFEPDDEFAVYRPERRAYIWSRKQLCVKATARVAVGPSEPITASGTVFVDVNAFHDDLRRVSFSEGGELTFDKEADLRKRVGLFLIRSKYDHWFGPYSGTLPGGIELTGAVGVRERQDALW